MTVRQPRYSKEEFARRGDEIYETRVRSLVEEGNRGKIVAIDIETGEFEIADDILTATARLFDRIPSAQPRIVRVGYRTVHRSGSRLDRFHRANRLV
ncbi:hypothetical protein V0288_24785 [Pannus brasiliensis CCIBt3594]|uniref:Uncharacterized protein n=1 Tax=Pannus brasiliensis CCIBt3594 TaxID=1427578 RepID=A0AAW9QZL9_9CHRO